MERSKARAYIFSATTLQIPRALWPTCAGKLSGSDPWPGSFWPETVLRARAFHSWTVWSDWSDQANGNWAKDRAFHGSTVLKQLYKVKVKWCIYIAPFPCNMLKGALQRSVYPQRTGSIYRRLWQLLQIGPCMLVLILPTPGGWKAEWTLAGKKVTQIFNPRPGRESNRGPQDWEAEILTTAPTPPLYIQKTSNQKASTSLTIPSLASVKATSSDFSLTIKTVISRYLRFCGAARKVRKLCIKIVLF